MSIATFCCASFLRLASSIVLRTSPNTVDVVEAMDVGATAITFARWAAYLGLLCGVLYAVGGFFIDLFTTGLNRGTALAFSALIGMPAIFAAWGFLSGALFAVVARAVRALLNG